MRHYHIWAGRRQGNTGRVETLERIGKVYRTRQAAHKASKSLYRAWDDTIIRECKDGQSCPSEIQENLPRLGMSQSVAG